MNPDQALNGPPDDVGHVADRNVERLLTGAYRPEVPDPAFIEKTTAAMHAAARQRASRPATKRRAGTAKRLVGWTVAAAVLVGLGTILGSSLLGRRGDLRQNLVERAAERPRPQTQRLPAARSYVPPVTGGGLTARARPKTPPIQTLAVGGRLETTSGQRRRVALPDGSVLYLNHDTAVTLDRQRHLTLDHGEMFVEVSPRHDAERTEGDLALRRFVVVTPAGQITALGTKFDVRTGDGGTRVVVTQGKVRISGMRLPLLAGQQLELPTPAGSATEPPVTAAPRLTHVLDWTRELMATAASVLVPKSQYAGGALVAVDPHGQESRLSLRKYHVDVYIEDGFSRTTIDQTYFNHEPRRLEGTFYFPLPSDASLSRLAMYVGGKLMEGGMVEREYGRQVFETIMYRQKDPALLEWVDGSTFKMRVFPLEGRQEKRIILSYTQRLPLLYNRTQYRFPAGHSMQLVGHWSARVQVRHGAPLRWESDSHEFQASRQDGDLVLQAAAEKIKPDRDIVLTLCEPGEGSGGFAAAGPSPHPSPNGRGSFATAVHEGSRYLMLRWRPDPQAGTPPARKQHERRDWVFLFEASGDRDPLLARVQVDVIKTLLENAERDDTFAILTAGTRVHAFAAKPEAATPENVQKAVEFLEHTHLIGALDLQRALAATGPFVDVAENPVLVHVGSGVPVLGQRDVDALVRRIPKGARYVGVGVGKRWSRTLMKTAASRTGGYFTQINPDESVAWRALELLSTLGAPRLLGIEVAACGGELTFLCHNDSLAQGEELCAIARMDDGRALPESVEVTGLLDGKPYSQTIPVGHVAEGAGYLPRIWAKLEIDRLVALGAVENKARIIELSKAMYVMSPFTSLLVLENDAMYQQYKVDRGRKDHWALYPCPAEIPVVYEPDPSHPGGEVPDGAAPRKPTASEILRTILVRIPPDILQWPNRPHRATAQSVTLLPRYAILAPPGVRLWNGQSAYQYGPLWKREQKIRQLMERLDSLMEEGQYGLAGEVAIGRETHSLMMMVHPRIIIQEEEEVAQTARLMLGAGINSDVGLVGSFVIDEQNFDWTDFPRSSEENTAAWRGAGQFTVGLGQPGVFSADLDIPFSPSGSGPVQIEMLPGLDVLVIAGHQRDADRVMRIIQGIETLSAETELGTRTYPVADLVLRIRDDARRYNEEVKALRIARQRGVVDTLNQIERAHVPFPDEPPIVYPDAELWDRLSTRGVAVYSSMSLARRGDARRRIEAALKGPTELQFIETPLQDVIDYLKDYHRIDIQIDRKALEDVGLDASTEPITRNLKGISLRAALRLMLRELDLSYVIEDEAILITTPEEAARRLASENHWYAVAGLIRRMQGDRSAEHVTYQQPSLNDNWAIFHELLSYAPGMNTSMADVRAVVEAEARVATTGATGKIDQKARELIEKARAAGWQTATIRGQDGKVLWSVDFDGTGRYRCERTTTSGLREQAVCDGTTLWHLYPELGLGARRNFSRFHRFEFARLVPWALPPAEDLAHGANLVAVDDRTVALVPHGIDDVKNEDGKPIEYVRLHLVFAADGRLAERRLVKVPSGETLLLRQTYAANGSVKLLGKEDKVLREWKIEVEPCGAPALKPDESELVILPLPFRTPEWVHGTRSLNKRYETLSEGDALAALASYLAAGRHEARQIIGRRFFSRGDRRVGFYALLIADGHTWDPSQTQDFGNGVPLLCDPLKDHPDHPLAQYVAAYLKLRSGQQQEFNLPAVGPASAAESQDGFLRELAGFRDLWQHWNSGRANQGDEAKRQAELRRTLEFVRNCRSPELGWALLITVRNYGSGQDFYRLLGEAAISFENVPALRYVARYEHARAISNAGDWQQAERLFGKLYEDGLEEGFLPPIDSDFRQAFRRGPDGGKKWQALVRETSAKLISDGARAAAVWLAWQVHQLGDPPLAEELLNLALTGANQPEQLPTTLAAVEYLWQTGQQARADALLQPLLDEEKYAKWPALWRLAAMVSEARGMTARSLSCTERAMEIEYENLPEVVNVQMIRNDYGRLLARYQQLAAAVATLQPEPPRELLARVVRAADRWRQMDTDPTAACHAAARILGDLGAAEMAWEYLTTPLAAKPFEAAPWVSMAEMLRQQGHFELADRAYASAFEAEPTNAQILWDRAQVLLQAGHSQQAKELFVQLAEGQWQPQFGWLKSQAQQYVQPQR